MNYLGKRVLLVGEGDCSFALSLIASRGIRRDVFFDDLTVTVLDTREDWRERYGEDKYYDIIGQLVHRGARVIFGVDATDLASNADFEYEQFDVIRWNFPHPHERAGKKSWNSGRRLMEDFLSRSGAPAVLSGEGEIHISMLNQQWGCWAMRQVLDANDFRLVNLPNDFQPGNYAGYSPADGNHLQTPSSGAADYAGRDVAKLFVLDRETQQGTAVYNPTHPDKSSGGGVYGAPVRKNGKKKVGNKKNGQSGKKKGGNMTNGQSGKKKRKGGNKKRR